MIKVGEHITLDIIGTYKEYDPSVYERVINKIAKEANVKKLILGHYSSRYIDKNIFFNEASTIFKDVDLSEDFKTFLV